MDASNLPKLKSAERNSDGSVKHLPGIYTHKDTHATYITAPGEEGSIQADALMSPIWEHSWEWTGDVPSRQELLKMRKVQELKDVLIEAEDKKKEKAEMAALEAEIKGVKETSNPAPGTGVQFDNKVKA